MEGSGEVGRASGPLQEAITLARAVVGVGSPSRTVLAPTRLVAAGGSSSERKSRSWLWRGEEKEAVVGYGFSFSE